MASYTDRLIDGRRSWVLHCGGSCAPDDAPTAPALGTARDDVPTKADVLARHTHSALSKQAS